MTNVPRPPEAAHLRQGIEIAYECWRKSHKSANELQKMVGFATTTNVTRTKHIAQMCVGVAGVCCPSCQLAKC